MVDDDTQYFDLGHLDHFLAQVVSELIYHYVAENGQDEVQQTSQKIARVVIFEFLLEQTATTLVIAVEAQVDQKFLVIR